MKSVSVFTATLIMVLFCGVVTAQKVNEKPAKIVLISIAHETDVFWTGIHGLAREAAKDLNADFKILFANRDHLRAIEFAHELAQSTDKPDYVIVVGERLIASQSIPALCSAGIKVMVYGDLTSDEKELIGEPRQKHPLYLGKIAIDDYSAGYLSAELIITSCYEKNMHNDAGELFITAFEGVRKTSFSSERVRGLHDVLAKYPKVTLLQSIPTQWQYKDSFTILPRLLKRYDTQKISGVWCANSELARGAAAALQNLGKKPGIDFVTSGTDWDPASVQAVSDGTLAGITGGHVAIISWIVTLMHDHHNGIDFDSSVYLNRVTMMDKRYADIFLQYFKDKDWSRIDYTKFSKATNKKRTTYDLSFKAILESL